MNAKQGACLMGVQEWLESGEFNCRSHWRTLSYTSLSRAVVTCLIVVPGWDHKWNKSDLAFLLRDCGVGFIEIARIAPSYRKGMAQPRWDTKLTDFCAW